MGKKGRDRKQLVGGGILLCSDCHVAIVCPKCGRFITTPTQKDA